MDGGAWWAAVHGVAQSQTQLSLTHTHTHTRAHAHAHAHAHTHTSALLELQLIQLTVQILGPISLQGKIFLLEMKNRRLWVNIARNADIGNKQF